jgi:hypothetical protein
MLRFRPAGFRNGRPAWRRRASRNPAAPRNAVSPWEAGAPRSAASRWEAAANPSLGAIARCSRTGSSNPANFRFLSGGVGRGAGIATRLCAIKPFPWVGFAGRRAAGDRMSATHLAAPALLSDAHFPKCRRRPDPAAWSGDLCEEPVTRGIRNAEPAAQNASSSQIQTWRVRRFLRTLASVPSLL